VQRDLDRFLALVRRELGSEDVQIVGAEDEIPSDPTTLRGVFPDRRGAVVVRFDSEPADRDSKQRRLDMLASTFDLVAEDEGPSPPSRPSPAVALRTELASLSAHARALNALVIDARSPVVWGAATGQFDTPARPGEAAVDAQNGQGGENGQGGQTAPEGQAEPEAPLPDATTLSRTAIASVRALADVAAMRRGPRADAARGTPRIRRVRHVDRDGEAPYLVHSFAGIYLAILVYAVPFDELRAERAILESLPRVERFVLALPPRDPEPPGAGAGVIAMALSRRPRRR